MYRKSVSGWLKHLDFIIVDMIILELSLVCAFFSRHGSLNLFANELYRDMTVVLLFLDIFVALFWESFKGVLRRGYYQEFVATLKHSASVILLSVLYLFSFQMASAYSRVTLFWTGGIYFVLSYAARLLWRGFLNRIKRVESGKRSVLVISTRKNVQNIVRDLIENNYERVIISGIVVADEDWTGKTICDIPVVANRENVLEYACHEWVDEVVVNLEQSMMEYKDFLDAFVGMGITVHWTLAKRKIKKQDISKIGSYVTLSTGVNMITLRQAFLKRVLDIIGGLAGCLITGILCVFIGPAIYLKSPGPIFFTQTRIGKNGRRFKIYKFRSMYMDAEERKKELMAQNKVKDGMMFKMDYDPRIIGSEKGPGKGIGNFVRKYSLDEFPQFLNVLKGDMSLVGTRPPTEDEWEKYQLHHRTRMAIKPGITGLWQVSGRSSITDFEEVVRLDTQYIVDWNLGLDIKILFKTVFAVIKKDGAV